MCRTINKNLGRNKTINVNVAANKTLEILRKIDVTKLSTGIKKLGEATQAARPALLNKAKMSVNGTNFILGRNLLAHIGDLCGF